jgi:Mce-associated membrane protein
MSTELPAPAPADEPAEPDERQQDERQERFWLSAGALIGVVVAAIAVGVVVLGGSRGGGASPAASAASAPTETSSPDPGAAVAAARDESLKAAEADVILLNSLDYHNTADGLNKWESVASAPLLDQLRSKRGDVAAAAEKNKTTSTARLLNAAVSQISQDNSSTEVLASVEVTVNDAKAATPTVKQLRQKLTMIHIADGWKASTFATVDAPG